MFRYKFILVILLFSIKGFCQDTPIQLDRPDQTECPFIVPTNWIQMENGINYENVTSTLKNYVLPTTLWKYGLNKNLEFRLITELVSVKNSTLPATVGINPITLGFKALLAEEKGLFPQTAFIGHLTTSNIGSKEFSTKYVAPSFRFLMQHTLSKKLVLAYNLGAEWNGETGEHTYLYTLTTGISITDKLGAYAELYGFAPADTKMDNRWDCGITYLLNNNHMLDLSGGTGLSASSPKSYLSLGYSFRFRAKK
jgi:hypothetical protein